MRADLVSNRYRSSGLTGWLRIVAWALIPIELMTGLPPVLWATTMERAGGINLYQYCNGDPVNCADPLGLETDPCRKTLPELNDDLRRVEAEIKKLNTPARRRSNLMRVIESLLRRKGSYPPEIQDQMFEDAKTLYYILLLELEKVGKDINDHNKCGPPPNGPSPAREPATEPVRSARVYPNPKYTSDKYQVNPVANTSVGATLLGLGASVIGIGLLLLL